MTIVRKPKSKYIVFSALALACAIITSACASSNSANGATPAGTFIVGIESQPQILVRALSSDSNVALVSGAIFEGLVATTTASITVGTVRPLLAQSWTISPNDETYTFHLRRNVSWQDGKPFTSADVVYTFDKIGPLNPNASAIMKDLASVTAPNAYTVVVKLTKPNPVLLLGLGTSNFSILPKHLYDGTNPLTNPYNLKPVGTGPYKFVSYSGNAVSLTANEHYWGNKPGYKNLVFEVIPDSNSRAEALEKGEIDYINRFSVDETTVQDLQGKKDIALINGRAAPTLMTMWWNVRQGPLANVEVRRALFMGLNRNLMSSSAGPKYASPAKGSFPTTSWADDTNIDYMSEYAYDPAKASALLDAAGYKRAGNGVRFSLTIRYVPTEPYTTQLAEIMQSEWKAIGVQLNLQQDESTVDNAEVYTAHNFDLTILSLATREDPSFALARVYECNPTNIIDANPTGYCNSTLDAIFSQAATTATKPGRAALYTVAQQIIAQDLPAVPLLQLDQPDAIRSDVKGVRQFLSGGENTDLTWNALAP